MATKSEEKVKCQHCGSENMKLVDKHEEEQYGYDTEGAGTGRTYLGTEVRRDYLCNNCGQAFNNVEIEK